MGADCGCHAKREDEGAGVDHDYLNARYYNGSQGQFTSQDPVFLGNPNQQHLYDPQSLNAYSYSEDNPIVKSDPTGRIVGVDDAIEIALLVAATEPEWEPVVQESFSDTEAMVDEAASTLSGMFENGNSVGEISPIDQSTLEARTEQEDLSWYKNRPIFNGAPGEETMVPGDVSSLLLKGITYGSITGGITIGIGYRALQGNSDPEDYDPRSTVSTNSNPTNSTSRPSPSTNNGNVSGSQSSYSSGGSYQSTISQLQSTLNQLQQVLSQLQSTIRSGGKSK